METEKQGPMAVVYRRTDELIPAPYNPRGMSEEALSGLKASITRFGFVDPVIVNKETGHVVGGHQRLKAAVELGMAEVPVLELSLNEKEERALNVSLNNPNISGFYTDDLQTILDDIKLGLGDDFMNLRLDQLVSLDDWESDIAAVDEIGESDEMAPGIIKITCPSAMKDEVLIFIKARLLETGFEGIHIE